MGSGAPSKAPGFVFAIGGSWASTTHGEPRQTNDIDIRDEHGAMEIERRQYISIGALSPEPVPVVSAEDTVLAKLRWYRAWGEVSLQHGPEG